MRWLTKNRVKYILAGVGAVYLVIFIGYLVYAGVNRTPPRGPSELEAHPERQDEILARQRADEMKGRLNLTDEQTQQVAEILRQNRSSAPEDGDIRGRWRAAQDEIAKVLTPEQKAQMDQTQGQFRGRGGFGGRMSPERIEEFKQKMTPEQRERFEKQMQEMQQRRAQRRGSRGPGGPQQ